MCWWEMILGEHFGQSLQPAWLSEQGQHACATLLEQIKNISLHQQFADISISNLGPLKRPEAPQRWKT